MRRLTIVSVLIRAAAAAIVMGGGPGGGGARAATPSKSAKQWSDSFNTPACVWSSTGKNDFFILEPGDQATFDGREGKVEVHLVITVLDETKKIGGVETRVVEERETHDGKLVEVSRNYFAVCGPGNTAVAPRAASSDASRSWQSWRIVSSATSQATSTRPPRR